MIIYTHACTNKTYQTLQAGNPVFYNTLLRLMRFTNIKCLKRTKYHY